MLYQTYEARRLLSAPLFGMAAMQSTALRSLPAPLARTRSARALRAVSDTLTSIPLTHRRPPFRIDSVVVDGKDVAVHEQVVASTPFASLLRFSKETDGTQPKVLVVPGLAGHFATLVRGTVKTLLEDHEVYVTDWHNARDVPVRDGRFGLDEYIGHLIDFMAEIGPGAHIMAVCQPCVPVLAAAALMEEDDHPAKPQSVILMAGPVDARINPGPVNEFATGKSMDMLERTVITTVPRPHKGAGRRVYPGFLQVMGFMGMAPKRHLTAFGDLFRCTAAGDAAKAESTKAFYAEYFAVLDVTAEFYLETARTIFQNHAMAKGEMTWNGRKVDPSAITSALLTIEAANDEMCPPGQTEAAHGLCTGIPEERKRHHLQAGVGHYGVFNGSKFEREIYPEIRSFVADSDRSPVLH